MIPYLNWPLWYLIPIGVVVLGVVALLFGSLKRIMWYGTAIGGGLLVGLVFYFTLGLNLPSIVVALISTMAFLAGFGLFFGLPFIVGSGSPRGIRYRVFLFYNWLSQQAFVRALLVKRSHAGLDLCASTFNAENGSERVKLDGEWRDFEDIADRMYYMRGPFGIVLEALTCVVDPVDAAIGARRRRVVEDGEEVVDFASIVGEEEGEAVREHITIPEEPEVVDLAEAQHVVGGSGEPSQGEATEEFERKAWAEYQGVPVLDVFMLALLFSAILFVIWLAFSFAASSSTGSGNGGGFNIVSGVILPSMGWWL